MPDHLLGLCQDETCPCGGECDEIVYRIGGMCPRCTQHKKQKETQK